jgi:hypothetical protein
MMNWNTGKPNARYWVLKLIKDNIHLGDKLVETKFTRYSEADGQAFATSSGQKLLLLNRRNRSVEITLPGGSHTHTVAVVDGDTGDIEPRVRQDDSDTLKLGAFAVAVVSWQ